MATRTKAAQKRDVACISICFNDYLIDADDAMAVMRIFRKAVECRKDFAGHDCRYVAGRTPRLELTMVMADQVVMPTNALAIEDQR